MTYIIPENIQKLIREFEQKDINKIFQIGNTLTFFVKSGGVTHPIKLEIINPPMPTGDQPMANLFFAKNVSQYPIDVRGAYFMITHPNQDIRSGKFDVLLIGKEGPDGFVPNKTKSRYTFKNIFKVDVRDKNNKLIDSYYTNDHDASSDSSLADKETKVQQVKVNDFITLLSELEKGDMLILTLSNKTNIKLDFIDTKGDSVQFEIDKTSNLSGDYTSLYNTSSIELSKNIDDITLDEKTQLLSIKGKAFNAVNGQMTSSDITINNIQDFSIGEESIKPDAEANPEDEYGDSTEEAKDMMQAILNDPIMKKAFYRQPTLWNLILSTIKGENPRGTGIGPAKDIITKYGENKIQKALGPQGDNFKKDKLAQFEVLNNEIVVKSSGISTEDLVLKTNVKYDAFVNGYKIGDDYVTLTNKKLSYRITIIRPYKDVPDAFEVKVTKIVKSKATGEINEYSKPGVIKFFNLRNSGYSKSEPIKTEPKQTPLKSIQPNNK